MFVGCRGTACAVPTGKGVPAGYDGTGVVQPEPELVVRRVGIGLRGIGPHGGDPGRLQRGREVRVLLPRQRQRVSVVGGVQPAGSAVPTAPVSVRLRSSMPPPVVSVVEAGLPGAGVGQGRRVRGRKTADERPVVRSRHLAVHEILRGVALGLKREGHALAGGDAIGEDTDADDWSMSGESAPLNWSLSAYW